MDTASRHHRFRFDSLMYAHPAERDSLAALLAEQNVSPVFEIDALRRRRSWATTLPLGTFGGDFRVGIASFDNEAAARAVAIKEAVQLCRRYIAPSRRLFIWEGNEYCPALLVESLRHVVTPRWFLNALHNFLQAAEKDPTLIRGIRQRPFVPLEQRKIAAHGGRVRGPAWTAEEDMIIRQWFGPRAYGEHAGKHVKLTDAEWAKVLERLGGNRTRCGVLARIRHLNHQLKRELTVDGYIPKTSYPTYFERVLGENPRPPRVSPVRRRRVTIARTRRTTTPRIEGTSASR